MIEEDVVANEEIVEEEIVEEEIVDEEIVPEKKTVYLQSLVQLGDELVHPDDIQSVGLAFQGANGTCPVCGARMKLEVPQDITSMKIHCANCRNISIPVENVRHAYVCVMTRRGPRVLTFKEGLESANMERFRIVTTWDRALTSRVTYFPEIGRAEKALKAEPKKEPEPEKKED